MIAVYRDMTPTEHTTLVDEILSSDGLIFIHGYYEELSENRVLIFYRGRLLLISTKSPIEENTDLFEVVNQHQLQNDKLYRDLQAEVLTDLYKGKIEVSITNSQEEMEEEIKLISNGINDYRMYSIYTNPSITLLIQKSMLETDKIKNE